MPNHSADPQGSLQILLDKQAIRELKYRYLNACDDKSPEQVTACFASGPVNINFGHIGQFANREDFVAVFVALGCHEHIVDMHHAENMLVEITGADTARARVGLRFHSINTQDKTTVQLGGFYEDEYRRIDGEWLISASTFNVRSALITDYSSGSDTVVWAANHMPPQSV